MRNRYQTGPVFTLFFFVVVLGMFLYDVFNALHFHHRNGWVNAAIALLILFLFDRRYKRRAE
jgi:hypothetical protein